jgi:class 3 adenylate cyclase/predicted ATPase
MTFEEILDQAIAMLQRRGRVTYRLLKRQFQLDDDTLGDLLAELRYAHREVLSEDEQGMVWTGGAAVLPTPPPPALQPFQPSVSQEAPAPQADVTPTTPPASDAERRQLTVLFCDLADSTRLARQLDPEDLREVMQAYQATCVDVIQRFAGHVAQYLGDGLLVYFGYPQAHEDEVQRAVRTGLGMLEAMGTLNARLATDKGIRLAVRIGIHTGLVVVGEMGSGGRHEHLALGDTPNLAARIQGLAAPDTVMISETTARLVQGYFTWQDREVQALKGLDTPVRVYQVMGESAAQSRLDVAGTSGLTSLVGRVAEVTLLLERWAQSTEGLGNVVVLSGEAGIGKSRLVQVLTDRVLATGAQRIVLRCSPYHTNSALYPVLVHLQQVLHFQREDTPATRLAKLEQGLQAAGLSLVEAVPLVAALLTVPVPDRYPPLNLSPQRQKQKTQETLVAWLLAEAAQHPVCAVGEDLHWADPSTLELLGLIIDQVPTAHLLLVLTARPEFRPPWPPRSHLTQLTLTRLTRPQVEEMVLRLTDGKPLPSEVVQQIGARTDGIPLFVEELVKTTLEAGLVREEDDGYVLTGPLPPLAVPATLHDSLMARLDRLATVKGLAQLGATLGREFSYALLRAVSPWDEGTLQQGLHQLVEAEFVYQRGRPPQATYLFKHALIQEAAYQSLLKSTRQQSHQRIAQVLEAQFPDTVAMQPELLAYHYTEAGLPAQALPYWQRAGQRASERSAYVEAVAHLTRGLEVLTTLPETPERTQHELRLQLALGVALIAAKGYAAPEVENVYTRAQTLCQALGDMPRLLQVLLGLEASSVAKAQLRRAHALAEQCLVLAQRLQHPIRLLHSHHALGLVLFHLGESTAALPHLERGMTLYDAQPHHPRQNLQNPGVACRSYAAWALWWLGYPELALQRGHEALTLAEELAHPYSTAYALWFTAALHQYRREAQRSLEQAAATIALATEHDFPFWWAMGTWLYGWALAEQGQEEDGIAQMRQGVTAWRATGAAVFVPTYLATLAEVSGKAGQVEDAQDLLREALALVEDTGERCWEAELYRLQGELLLARSAAEHTEAESCFHQALDIARRQQAKSFELRATMSLSRLWQRQGGRVETRELLAPVYGWFTEGFDTADLQEAKALLDALA